MAEQDEDTREFCDNEEDEAVKFLKPSSTEHPRERNCETENGFLSKKVPSELLAVESPEEESGTTSEKPFCQPSIRGVKTVCLFFAFIGLGISNAMYGPTILDLAYYTRSRVAQMSYVFIARAVGFFIGTVTAGWLFDKLHNRYFVLGCSSLGLITAMFVFPVLKSVYALMVIGAVMTAFSGMFDTAGNAFLFVYWPRKSQPYMQMLHFTYALGAFLAPLLAKPFLLPASVTNSTTNATTNGPNPEGIPSVVWAYWLGTIPCVLTGIFFLVCCFVKSLNFDKVPENENQAKACYSSNKVFKAVVLILLFMLVLFYVGIEEVYSGFIFTFAVKSNPRMSPDDGAVLTSAFWISFACGRLFTVPLTKFLRSQSILFINLMGCLIASVILLSQVHGGCSSQSSAKLWAGSVLLGASTSSIFPTMLSWVEDFLEVSGRVMSFLFVGGCVGAMTFPVFVGSTFESIGPCTFLYCIFMLSSICLILYFAIFMFARYFKPSNTSSNSIELQVKSKLNEETVKSSEQIDGIL